MRFVVLGFAVSTMTILWFQRCNEKDNEKQIEVYKEYPKTGEYYTISFTNNKNPFEIMDIDTVLITGVKQGYIEWEYFTGRRQSTRLDVFNDCIIKKFELKQNLTPNK